MATVIRNNVPVRNEINRIEEELKMSEEMATYWFNKMYELGIIHEVLRQEGVIK